MREKEIREACQKLADLLVSKNAAYGDSALNPVRVFSDATPLEQMLVRIDDKLSRIIRGDLDAKKQIREETDLDLAGYFILRHISKSIQS